MAKPSMSEVRNPRETIERRMAEAESSGSQPQAARPTDKAMSQASFSGYDKPRPKSEPPASMVKRYKHGGVVKRSASHPTGKCK